MNASARREDLFACLDYAWSGPAGLSARQSGRRPSALGWMLLTGLACSGSLQSHAADWLSIGKPEAAASAAATATDAGPKAPTPPLPPSPPVAEKPAGTETPSAKTATQEQATSKDKTAAKATAPSTVATTWKSLTSWLTPPSSAPKAAASATPPQKTAPQPRASAGVAAPATAVTASSARSTGTPGTGLPTTTVGRFDPDFGPAGHFVTDADERESQLPTQFAPPRLATPSQLPTEPDKSVVATDEPVTLVSWLASYYSGGHGAAADACPDVCLTDHCCPRWEAQIDALFLWQGNIPSRPLYVDSVTNATVLDANQLYAPAAIAPRYALTYHRDDCRAIEVNYFQVWGFNAQQLAGPQTDTAGNGAFAASNLVGPDYNQVSGALATSSASIQSLEVNLRRTDGGMIEWISGFRWLQWGQNLTLLDSITESNAFVGGDLSTVDTLNNLYGWQWGGDMMLWNAGRWLRVNGIAKAGVYYNHQSSQNSFYTNFIDPAADVNVAAAKDTVSFVGETGINASLALTNWLSWRAGYTFFWLGGMATPARQLGLYDATAATTSVNTNGSVLLHGVNTGLEARW